MLMTFAKTQSERRPFTGWLLVAYILVITVSMDLALLFCAAFNWGRFASAASVLVAALIAGGLLFTVLQMSKLADRVPK